ncbi:MAG: hypothetical protein LLF76_10600, partial [Planctomycetaceae bacterium]|nr:hypothetical protein [Planctomycetaceae bacterium]
SKNRYGHQPILRMQEPALPLSKPQTVGKKTDSIMIPYHQNPRRTKKRDPADIIRRDPAQKMP